MAFSSAYSNNDPMDAFTELVRQHAAAGLYEDGHHRMLGLIGDALKEREALLARQERERQLKAARDARYRANRKDAT